jgi:AraC-like DNA-binding protein
MSALIRSASLTHFADVAARCGLDAAVLVRDAGLPRRCLEDPDLRVAAHRVARLLELAAERGAEPAFGLRMAESRRLSNLGPLGLLLRDEPTLRAALEAVLRYLHLHNEAMSIRLEEVSSLVVIRVELEGGHDVPLRQATELAVGVMFRVLRLFLGAAWRPRLVCFTHAAPRSLAVHRRVLGEAVEFGHEFNSIVCNAHDLDAGNPGADPVMNRYAKRLLGSRPRAQASWSARVKELVLLLLPRGHCSVETVAQHLGVDRRTVARHLAHEGTSFSALVDGMRAELLARYEAEGARRLSEVAALLGFSAPSNFSRWHRLRFGASARARRAKRGMAP